MPMRAAPYGLRRVRGAAWARRAPGRARPRGDRPIRDRGGHVYQNEFGIADIVTGRCICAASNRRTEGRSDPSDNRSFDVTFARNADRKAQRCATAATKATADADQPRDVETTRCLLPPIGAATPGRGGTAVGLGRAESRRGPHATGCGAGITNWTAARARRDRRSAPRTPLTVLAPLSQSHTSSRDGLRGP